MSKQNFARVVTRWADGEQVQFRVSNSGSAYGSKNDWHAMDNPWFDDNFDYRVISDVELLNLYAKMHDGED